MINDRPTTIIGIMHVELRIPLCNSLKEKRSAIRPCLSYLHDKFNVATAEVANQDAWRSAMIALVTVSNDKTQVESTFRQTEEYFERRPNLEVLDVYTEIL